MVAAWYLLDKSLEDDLFRLLVLLIVLILADSCLTVLIMAHEEDLIHVHLSTDKLDIADSFYIFKFESLTNNPTNSRISFTPFYNVGVYYSLNFLNLSKMLIS